MGLGRASASEPKPDHDPDPDQAMLNRLQALLNSHQAEVFACVQAEPKDPSGEMLVRVFAAEGGKVGKAEVLKDETGSKTLRRCLTDKIRAWDLGSLQAAEGDQVVFPLAFRRAAKQTDKPNAGPQGK